MTTFEICFVMSWDIDVYINLYDLCMTKRKNTHRENPISV